MSSVPIFAGLSRPDQERVAALARSVTFEAGDVVADERATPRLLVVHEGMLKASRLSRGGTEQLLRVIGPGDFVGEADVLSGVPSSTRVTATERTSACAFSHEAVAGLLRTHPQVMLRIITTLSRRLELAEDRLAALTSSDTTARLADYLLGLPAEHHDGSPSVTLPLPKREVASLIGTTPESFSRGLARLARSGLVVVDGGRVTILDSVGLETVATGG